MTQPRPTPPRSVPPKRGRAGSPEKITTEWISRAECGRRLGVTAMRVTQYTRMGMPTRAEDKRVPWPAVRDWHRDNVIP
jgi:hypothetical protein